MHAAASEILGNLFHAPLHLHLDSLLGEAELERDLFLRHGLQLPPHDDFSATRGKTVNGLGQQLDLLPRAGDFIGGGFWI
jgi:hypothetical protein